MNRYNNFTIRLFDLVVSLVSLLLLLPIFFFVSIGILLDSGFPVFFKQKRIGKDKKEFKIIKFRTMTNNTGSGRQITVGNDSRITPFGKYLRSTKVDELPQLINIIKGDMAFVGPRPEVPKYVEYYSKEECNIFNVYPGITDYASIKYRNENEILSASNDPESTYVNKIMKDKLQINLNYIEKRSLNENIKVIFLTIKAIVLK